MCIPPMALMSQNKRINPPTAHKANTQLEGFVWEGGSTRDNSVINGTSFPWGAGGLPGNPGGQAGRSQPGMKRSSDLGRAGRGPGFKALVYRHLQGMRVS